MGYGHRPLRSEPVGVVTPLQKERKKECPVRPTRQVPWREYEPHQLRGSIRFFLRPSSIFIIAGG